MNFEVPGVITINFMDVYMLRMVVNLTQNNQGSLIMRQALDGRTGFYQPITLV